MNNYNYTRPPRKGVIIFVSFVFAAIFGIAFFSAYEQRTDLGHSVHISPTSANYGIVSTARPQALVVPMQSSAPMLSGGAIRSYAYSGHATMPKASSAGSNFKMYTTSSASVHSLGSGGGGGGGSMSGGSSYRGSSSKGIQYSGGSVSLPSLALATPTYASLKSDYNTIGPRRVKPTGAGDDGEWRYGGNPGDDPTDWWYYDDEDGWVGPKDGDTRPAGDGNNYYKYDKSSNTWILVNDQGDPVQPTPLGDAPWHWMLLLALVYISVKVLRKRMTGLSTITID